MGENEIVPLDFFGNEITVNSFIVYPTRSGSSTNMRIGLVKEIENSEDWRGRTFCKLHMVSLKRSWFYDSKSIEEQEEMNRWDEVYHTTVTEYNRAVVVSPDTLDMSGRRMLLSEALSEENV